MKHLTHFCIKHDLLPGASWLRRMMLRSIFKPASDEQREYGADEVSGWYDLGHDVTQEQAARFKEWESNRGQR